MSTPPRPSLREAPYGYTVSLVAGAAETLKHFVAALWNPAGEVSERVKEFVFLRTSLLNRCEP
jgi:hypothetical protein